MPAVSSIPTALVEQALRLPKEEAFTLLRPYVAASVAPSAATQLAGDLQDLSWDQFAEGYTSDFQVQPWPDGVEIPDFPTFIAEPRYLGEVSAPLTPHQEKCLKESIGLHFRDWMVNRREISLLVWCWGKGSGKDLISARVLAYTAYCIAKMRNPWATFGQAFGEVFDCINVAQDAKAARENFYDRFIRMVKRPCFEGLLNQKDSRQGGDISSERTEFKATVEGIDYPVVVLRVHSLHSKNEAAEGKNTLFWVMDEADALRTADNDDAARLMFRTLRTSNRFNWRQLGIVISYPRSANGFVFWALRQCGNLGGNTPEWWGDKAPTWKVLPWKSYQAVVWKGRRFEADAFLAQLYRDDPTDFWATYGVRPPAVEGAFIDVPEKIDQATAAARAMMLEPLAKVEPALTRRQSSDGTTKEFVALMLSDFRFRPGMRYFLGGDAGINHDSFALCLAYAIPRGERGFLCPRCWGMADRRYAKHYRAVPVPVNWPHGRYSSPAAWRCDWDGKDGVEHPLPARNLHRFWGVVDSPGGREVRQQKQRVDAEGNPVRLAQEEGDYALEDVWLPMVVEALLLEWKPDRRRNLTVDYLNVRDVILELNRQAQRQGASIAHARFDKWQAEAILQEMLQAGIPISSKGMSNPQQLAFYRVFKSALYNNLLLLQPDREGYPCHARARDQLRNLVRENNRVDHPKGAQFGKDLTDAEGMAFQLAVEHHAYEGHVYLDDDSEGRAYLEQAGEQILHEEAGPRGYSIVGAALGGRGIL